MSAVELSACLMCFSLVCMSVGMVIPHLAALRRYRADRRSSVETKEDITARRDALKEHNFDE